MLAKDLRTACALYVQTRDDLQKMMNLHRESVPTWSSMSRETKIVEGEVQSVYCHSVKNGEFPDMLEIHF